MSSPGPGRPVGPASSDGHDRVSPDPARTKSPSASETVERLPGPDVVRAVALIGVVVMNYHGYLVNRGASRGSGGVAGFFDPFSGPMATRFAATFVLMAGVGVTLLTRGVTASARAGAPGAHDAVADMRWRLVRRGVVLYVLGRFLDLIWPGTIIVYYGAMFVLAAALFTLRSRWIVSVGVAAAVAGAAVNGWIAQQRLDGGDVGWLVSPGDSSVRRFVFDVAVNGTHPLLPWLVFFCAGIVLGRLLGVRGLHRGLALAGVVLFVVGRLLDATGGSALQAAMTSTEPQSRSLAYVASALGTALLAFAVLDAATTRLAAVRPELVDPLRRAGQMTLTIYVAHILFFNLLVDWLGVVEPDGLRTSLTFAFVFWLFAIAAAAQWHRRVGRGPAELVYRRLGG